MSYGFNGPRGTLQPPGYEIGSAQVAGATRNSAFIDSVREVREHDARRWAVEIASRLVGHDQVLTKAREILAFVNERTPAPPPIGGHDDAA
jgi:hypothetical protein